MTMFSLYPESQWGTLTFLNPLGNLIKNNNNLIYFSKFKGILLNIA